jgi:flagellar hook-associated protein 1 FlgK
MSGLFGAIQAAKSGLLAHERGLSVVSSNIANVNTPDYIRRRMVFEEAASTMAGGFEIGRGVEATEVQRILNSLLEAQLITEHQTSGGLDIMSSTLARLETTLDESSRVGISGAINELFIAFQSLADNPGGAAERLTLIEKANALADQFGRVEGDIQSLQRELDLIVPSLANEINQLTSQIADLNQKILEAEAGGNTANDLRDKRSGLMVQLADKMSFRYFEDDGGMVTIMASSGHLLVSATQSFNLETERDPALDGLYSVNLVLSESQTVDLTSSLGEGRLGTAIELRDTVLPQYLDTIDELAAALIVEVNAQHRLGYGLDGSTNNDFFSPIVPTEVNTDLLTDAQVDDVWVADFASVYESGDSFGDQYTIVSERQPGPRHREHQRRRPRPVSGSRRTDGSRFGGGREPQFDLRRGG